MSKLFALLLLPWLALLSGVALAQPLGLGTSPQGTMTYAVGAAVAKVLAEHGKIQARVQPSSGTGTMVPLVNSGEIDLGFCNTLELSDSFQGVGTANQRPNPNLRVVAILFPIKVGLFVRNDSPIRSVSDLKGKTIAHGFASQEVIKLMVDGLLATGGLSVKDMKTVLVPNLGRGVDEFIAGRVDATAFALGAGKVSEADASVGGIRFLPVSDSPTALEAMRKIFPTAYLEKVAPGPGLTGVREPITTMAYDYTLFANASVPADRIQRILGILVAQKAALAQNQPLFRDMRLERMYGKLGVPYHPGAVAYFREQGVAQSP
jgi:uncharacterized protein